MIVTASTEINGAPVEQIFRQTLEPNPLLEILDETLPQWFLIVYIATLWLSAILLILTVIRRFNCTKMEKIIMNVELKEQLKIRDKLANMDVLEIMEYYIQKNKGKAKVTNEFTPVKCDTSNLDIEEG